ncbi:MAG TPA: phage recombination protein Bet, partial [Flexistipes sinusarabici]|nr:phage recombination protein Bet [Flexistipes sinusarabici]
SIAHKSGQLAGIETVAFIKKVPRRTKNGWELVDDLVARCTVYRKDTPQPFVVEVCFSEYAQKTKEGHLTSFWAEKPETMLKKVAESQCLRKAFNINGIYGAEEIGYGTYDAEGMVIRDPEAEESREEPETPKEEKKEKEEVEPNDKAQLLEYLANFGFTVKHGKHDPDRVYVRGSVYGKPQVSKLLDKYFLHVKEDIYQLL